MLPVSHTFPASAVSKVARPGTYLALPVPQQPLPVVVGFPRIPVCAALRRSCDLCRPPGGALYLAVAGKMQLVKQEPWKLRSEGFRTPAADFSAAEVC